MTKKVGKMLMIELGLIILVLSLFIIIKNNMLYIFPECIVYKYLGILCPSCRGTRCIINFLNGNFYKSFLYHPIFFITIIYLIIFNIVYIINSFRKKDILKFLYPNLKIIILFIVIILVYTVLRNVI